MKAEIEKLAEALAHQFWYSTVAKSRAEIAKMIRPVIVQGIELALKQEASGPMCVVGSQAYMSGVPIVKLFGAMRAVQLAEFTKEMK